MPRATVERVCERCGVTFAIEVALARRGQGRYCTRQCANARPPTDPLERAWRYILVEEATGCWLWQGFIDKAGYGRLHGPGRSSSVLYAHRLLWEGLTGMWVPGTWAFDHLCRVRHCCNPAHLEPVTPAENARRGAAPTVVLWRANRCHNGHDLSDPTIAYTSRRGLRHCRVCSAARARAAWARRRDALAAQRVD